MKASVCLAAIPLLIGVAMAQNNPPQPATPPSESQAPATTNQNQNRNQDQDRNQTGTADRNQDQTKPKSNTATDTRTTTATPDHPAEMKTQTYKGTLMDATCAAGGGSSAAADRSANTSSSSTNNTASNNTSGEKPKKHKNEANRSAGGSDQASCPVSSSTSQFALRTKDGQTLKFDMVGNARAQEAIKNKKKWTEAASSGKAIQAHVSGVMSGDKLTVTSVD